MRIAAVTKMGYYPTPEQTLELIAKTLRPAIKGGSFRFLDPCVGEGEALAAVAQAFTRQGAKPQTYGVELSYSRFGIAKNVLTECIAADWADVTVAHKSFSLLYLNPPYDTEAGKTGVHKRRLEYVFLQNTLKTLQAGGLLVYIVPLRLMALPNVAKFLAGYFEHISLYKLPAGEYERFGQAVVFGYRKEAAFANDEEAERISALAASGTVPSLETCQEQFVVPPSTLPAPKFFIRKTTLTHDEVVAAIVAGGVHTTTAWKDATSASAEYAFTPVVPLKTGHIGGLIASGQMGTVPLGDILAKGRCIKVVDTVDDHGNVVAPESEKATAERERFETRVFTLNAQGEFIAIEKTEELQGFLTTHAGAIAAHMASQYKPLYSEPTRAEWDKLAKLLPGKYLPGRKVSGLLPAQKHVAIAASRSAHKNGWADVVGEMGTGKTTMALATLELIPNAYPAIVLCPGHIVAKWAREAEEVIPGARGVVIDSMSDLLELVRMYVPGDKVIAVISKERAKLGSGWKPATVQRRRRLRMVGDNNQVAIETVTVHTCPKCGAVVTDEAGLPLPELPKKRLFCDAKVKKWKGDPNDKTKGEFKEVACGNPLYEISGFRRYPISRYIRTKLKGFFKVLIADEFHQMKGSSTDQAGSYHDLVMATEYCLNLTGTLFGGKSTDLFWLRYRIDRAVRRDFGFRDEIRWASMYGRLERTLQKEEEDEDGKFSGRRRYITRTKELPGTSPAIFARLLTSCIFVRITDLGWQLPSYDETVVHLSMNDAQQAQYTALNEVLMSYIKVKGGKASKYERQVAQKLLGVWLQNCLGRPNSAFRSETVMYSVNKEVKLPVPIENPMPETECGEPVEPILVADYLADVPRGAIKKDDIIIDGYGEYGLHLAPTVAEGELLPKEEWLIDYCLYEIAHDRKVLLYVRQTGTRDIQPRLKNVLEQHGLKAVILPDTVEPKKREAWIKDRVGEIDVLITNPKKVETGLDLIQFSTCIFYELDYSLFTLWQAMRRVWRLGQRNPVKVLFPVYRDTMEAAALSLMGRKMQAALLLYGDNAGSAITDEAGDSGADFTAELASRLLAGEELSSNGITGLLKATVEASEAGFGWETPEDETEEVVLPTPANVEAVTFEEAVKTWNAWVNEQSSYVARCLERAAKRRTRKPKTTEQLSLFDQPASKSQDLQLTLF